MDKIKALIFFLGSAFLLVFIYNFFVALDYKYEADGDAYDYIHMGLTVAKTGNYGHLDVSRSDLIEDFKAHKIKAKEYKFTDSTAFRPPVWPFIIAGIFFVFGYNLLYVLIIKFLLHLVGVYIFYKTLTLLKLHKILIISGAFLYAISPAWQLYSRVFLSEPVTLFFITLWLYLLVRFLQKGLGFIPQALVGGLLILSHPYYIFLPFSIWLILFLKENLSLKHFIVSSFICTSVVSLWIIRNFIVLETNQIVLTTSSGAVMAKGWNNEVPEKHTNTKGDLADETLVLQDFEYNKNHVYGEVDRMVFYKDASIHFVGTHPEIIFPIIGKKLASAFNPFPETPRPGILETGRWIFQFLALIALVYIFTLTQNRFIISLAIGLVLSTIGITILTYSGFRFRMPQIGLELLLIIYVVDDLVKRRKTGLKPNAIE